MPEMPTATTTRSEIMLEGLIDYAGLYPPANLDMQGTVDAWSANYSSEDRWMLGRLIIPASRLDEFTQAAEQLLPNSDEEPWQLSVLLPEASSDGFVDSANAVVAFNMSDCGAIANVVEFKASSTAEIDSALSCLHDDIFPFIELPINQDPRGLIAALAGSIAGAKVRTGGTVAELYPSAEDLSRFIHCCAISKLQFKATAGMHHPCRNYNESVGVHEFGFLSVLYAAAAAKFHNATPEGIVDILQTDEVDLDSCTEEMLECVRAELFCSFGSCSIDDPRTDLQAMGLLQETQ
jgi:hypothetical protein